MKWIITIWLILCTVELVSIADSLHKIYKLLKDNHQHTILNECVNSLSADCHAVYDQGGRDECNSQTLTWISAEERLPDIGETVYVKGYSTSDERRADVISYIRRDSDGSYKWYCEKFNPSHWMPIPKLEEK